MRKSVKLKAILLSVFLILLFSESIVAFATYGRIKVSVIVPVYNTELYLRDCLNSIINQTLDKMEIICVNDGSTDDSLNILEEYAKKDPRFRILNQKNQGAANARNVGLSIAKGEYIAFVDSDDTLDLDTYEIGYKNAKEIDADILMFGEDKHKLKDFVYTDGFKVLRIPGALMLWNKLYKRSFLIDNNFFIHEQAMCYHDECFNSIVIPKANLIRCISNKFYHYRRKREGSIQTSASARKSADNTLIYARYVSDIWRKNNYVKDNGLWLLRKIILMINRSIDKLDNNYKKYFSNEIFKIINGDIYTENNINSLSRFEKSLMNKWIKDT